MPEQQQLEAGISYAVARAIGYEALAEDLEDERNPSAAETIDRLRRIGRTRATSAAYRDVAHGLSDVRQGVSGVLDWFLQVLGSDDEVLRMAAGRTLAAMVQIAHE